jgi:DNA adenine methylase
MVLNRKRGYVELRQDSHNLSGIEPLKPLVRWAGSKKRELKKLTPFLPDKVDYYIEPFCGSACLFFHLQPAFAILSDLNRELINFYRQARLNPVMLYDEFSKIERSAEVYYNVRKRFNSEESSVARAVLFYYLNRNAFNGIFRTSISGQFNVPFSSSRVAEYLSFHDFSASAARLWGTKLSSVDFEPACRICVKKDAFVFLDPPYFAKGERIFSEYSRKAFSMDDLKRLYSLLIFLDSKQAKFLMTFAFSEQVWAMFRHWKVDTLLMRRSVAGSVRKRVNATELVIRNFEN